MSSASSKAQKFKTRYATLGFSDKANLDEGHMWPTAFALTKGADRRRGGKDRRARKESGELRTDSPLMASATRGNIHCPAHCFG